MVKLFLIAKMIMFFLFSTLMGQDLSQMHIVGSAEFLTNELISNNIRDTNGEVCAGIMIVSDLEGLTYQSNNGIVDKQSQPGKDLLYVSPSERVIEVYKFGYEPLRIILSDISVNLQSGKVWQIKITGDKKAEQLPISIASNVDNPNIYIDEILKGSGRIHQVGLGEHIIRIEKEGYNPVEKTVSVSENNADFSFLLERVEQQLVTFMSDPPNARLYINNFERGTTNIDDFKFPGTYKIRLSKPGYFDLDEEIEVVKGKENKFTFKLEKNSGSIIINTVPPDAKIIINQQNIINSNQIDLPPGQHSLEISKGGYQSIYDIVDLKLDEIIHKNYVLEMITGMLQFTVKPREARAILKQNGKVIKSWEGSKLINDVGIGAFILECSYPGYIDASKNIMITENNTTIENISLIESNSSTIKEDKVAGEMVFVKGGELLLGSINDEADEAPKHLVRVDDFFIGKYEVTFSEFDNFCDKTGRKLKNDVGWGKGMRPIIAVTYEEAEDYCEWLSRKTGDKYRLPTEAEWEYAASGGQISQKNKYSGGNNFDEVAWTSHAKIKKTEIVGLLNPNEIGIYDMSGNVWEWCSDWYSATYYSELPYNNPNGPSNGIRKILRGGSWNSIASSCRVTNRNKSLPEMTDFTTGFRIVKEVKKSN
jgi:formylglycine-generating enzyme required for sulfatase activity